MAEERAFGPVRLIPAANQGRYPHSNSVYVDGAGVLLGVVAMRDLLGVFGPISVKGFDSTFTADNLLERLVSIVEVQMGPTGKPRKGVLVLLANELTSRMMAMKTDVLLATSTALAKSANA